MLLLDSYGISGIIQEGMDRLRRGIMARCPEGEPSRRGGAPVWQVVDVVQALWLFPLLVGSFGLRSSLQRLLHSLRLRSAEQPKAAVWSRAAGQAWAVRGLRLQWRDVSARADPQGLASVPGHMQVLMMCPRA